MLQALVKTAGKWLRELNGSLRPQRPPATKNGTVAPTPRPFQPLQRVLLTDGVSRTLFEEYAAHRESACGEEETGWVILGHRDATEATVLATLPAGTQRQAGVAHIQFNALGQTVGSRIVRQLDRRLSMLGVVHTHPGSLRHPSDGDFRGDSAWVGQLRGQEGIFGIGTADSVEPSTLLGHHPKPHVQTLGNLRLSWYGLHHGDHQYRPLPVDLILGPDLARPLHSIWPTIEMHAEQLDRLARQQVGVHFDLVDGPDGPGLTVNIPLAEPGEAIRVLLGGKEVHYMVERGGQYLVADSHEVRIDHGVYLLLAELAS